MKKVLLSLLLLSACGRPVDPNLELINPDSSPEWIGDTSNRAIDFWSQRGHLFSIHPSGIPIKVGTVPDGNWGMYDPSNEEIVISQEAEELNEVSRSCLLAHELGHFIGMDHVNTPDEGSLMLEILTICADPAGAPQCCWSGADQAEFDSLEL